jgi:hypothetical protein
VHNFFSFLISKIKCMIFFSFLMSKIKCMMIDHGHPLEKSNEWTKIIVTHKKVGCVYLYNDYEYWKGMNISSYLWGLKQLTWDLKQKGWHKAMPCASWLKFLQPQTHLPCSILHVHYLCTNSTSTILTSYKRNFYFHLFHIEFFLTQYLLPKKVDEEVKMLIQQLLKVRRVLANTLMIP